MRLGRDRRQGKEDRKRTRKWGKTKDQRERGRDERLSDFDTALLIICGTIRWV